MSNRDLKAGPTSHADVMSNRDLKAGPTSHADVMSNRDLKVGPRTPGRPKTKPHESGAEPEP